MGYIIVFKITQIQIKKEVKRELKSKVKSTDLHLISFSKNDLDKINWMEEEKEFLLNNKMYDIVKKEISENSVLFYCIDDKKEAELFANLDVHINKHLKNHSSSQKNTIKVTDDKYKISHASSSGLINYYSLINHQTAYILRLFSVNQPLSTPPPNFS